MCDPASFVVTRNAVLFDKDGDSHEVIIKNNNLADNSLEPSFVRVEISPPDNRYDLPFEQWVFQIDQDILPAWYDEREVEIAVRTMLPEWWKHHANTPTCEKKQTRIFTEGEHVVHDGVVWFYENSVGAVVGGEAGFFDNSAGVVSVGKASFYNKSVGTVKGGTAQFFDNAIGTVNGGAAEFYNKSVGTVVGGRAQFFDNAIGTVNGGAAEFYNNAVGAVHGGVAWFRNNAVGAVYGGEVWFHGNAVGTIHGGVAHVYNRNCKVVLAEGSTGEIVNHF